MDHNAVPSRYIDPVSSIQVVKLLPCQLYITECLDEMVATVLGSCVSACIRDPVAGVAGMNHFMLPQTEAPRNPDDLTTTLRYGNHAMDMLLEGLQARGGRLNRLEVKLFGGAKVTVGKPVGEENVKFALSYLRHHRLRVAAQHLGGMSARRVHYFPATGLVLMRQLRPSAVSSVELQPGDGRLQIREKGQT